MSEAEFQAFIDGPGPDAQQIGVFTNHVFKMMDGGKAPASYFAKGAPEHENVPNAPGSGSFFWIEHEFVSEEAANKFWGMVSSWTADDWVNGDIQNAANGWFNHVFLPTSPSGNVFCCGKARASAASKTCKSSSMGPTVPRLAFSKTRATRRWTAQACCPPSSSPTRMWCAATLRRSRATHLA